MRAALIINDKAGTLAGLVDSRGLLEAALRAGGFDVVAPCSTAADTPDDPMDAQWRSVEASDAIVVFVAGGDGTLRDAAARMMHGSRIFAPLPGGTMNRVCARLGLGQDPLAAAAAYRPTEPSSLHVASANGEVFLYQSIVGKPTRLLRIREKQRGTGWAGWWPLVVAMVRSILGHRSRRLTLRMPDGARLRGHAAIVTTPSPEDTASLRLDLARPRHALARLRQAVRWFRGRLAEDAQVASRQGTHLVVHGGTPMMRFSLDGEMRLTRGPIKYRLHRNALRLLTPPLPTHI